jgi:hypothetical protein
MSSEKINTKNPLLFSIKEDTGQHCAQLANSIAVSLTRKLRERGFSFSQAQIVMKGRKRNALVNKFTKEIFNISSTSRQLKKSVIGNLS